MNWLKDNWDKLLTLVLGGFVGYFSGIIATNRNISSLSERLRVVETKQTVLYDPKMNTVDTHALELIRLGNSIANVKDQQGLTDRLVDIHVKEVKLELDKVRVSTIAELRQFLQASTEAHAASQRPTPTGQ